RATETRSALSSRHGTRDATAPRPALVLAPRPALRRHPLGTVLQLDRAQPFGRSLLLLVPVSLDRHRRRADRPRVLRDAERPMTSTPNVAALVVFGVLFALVTVLGFVAARWRQGDLDDLH